MGSEASKRQSPQRIQRPNINAVSCIRCVIPWNTCQTKTGSPSVRILKQSSRRQRKKKRWPPWNGSRKNGVKNIPIPWGAGNRTGTPYPRFSNVPQRSERSYIRPTPLRAWMPLTESWTVREACSQAILLCWKRCTCLRLKPQRSGRCQSETGDRYMVNWALCTKVGYRNKRIHLSFTGGFSACSWHAAIVAVINTARAESPKRSFQPS